MLTQEELKNKLHYNPDTGVFTRRKLGKKQYGVTGGYNGKGYLRITVGEKRYYSHRLAWLYMYGAFPSGEIDHKNHIRDDNRISNLRDVDGKTNHKNISMYKNNISGCTGVCFKANRWVATINVDKETINLGSFVEFHEAVNARKNGEVLYGFHENHGKDIL